MAKGYAMHISKKGSSRQTLCGRKGFYVDKEQAKRAVAAGKSINLCKNCVKRLK